MTNCENCHHAIEDHLTDGRCEVIRSTAPLVMKTGMWAVVKQYPWDTGYTIETLKVAQVCRDEIISKHRTYEAAKRALILSKRPIEGMIY